MDSSRFDALTRAFATAASRRRALGALAALAAAPLAAAAQPKPTGPQPAACLAIGKRCSQKASAGASHDHGKHGGKGKHHPPSCDRCCTRSGAAGSDGKSRCACKSEEIACDGDSQCCSGQCRNQTCTGCAPNTVFCPAGCANLQTDPHHCGSCTNACASGQRRLDGTCVCDATSCPRGCCAKQGTCQRGTSGQACGVGGAGCQTCDECTTCDGMTCAPTDGVCCDGGAGVCQGGACTPCVSPQVCFAGGCCAPDCDGKCGGACNDCGGSCTADCGTGFVCRSQICVACSANGSACAQNGDCCSDNCSNGFCCDPGRIGLVNGSCAVPCQLGSQTCAAVCAGGLCGTDIITETAVCGHGGGLDPCSSTKNCPIGQFCFADAGECQALC